MERRRKVVEIFSTDDRRSRELIDRLFRLPLRDCVVQVRSMRSVDASATGPIVRVDGHTVIGSAHQRISTRALLEALENGHGAGARRPAHHPAPEGGTSRPSRNRAVR